MKNRLLSLALAVLMLAALVPFTTTPALAASSPSFSVKYEKDFGEDGTVLFSEEPVQILTGDEYYRKQAYVFPVGTKAALKVNGALVPICTFWETPYSKGEREYYNSEQNEITLRAEIANDAKGIRIASTVGQKRGLLIVFVSNAPISTAPPLTLTDGDFVIENGVLTKFTGRGHGLHVTVPDGVKEIGECVFYGHDGLVSVTLPDSVTKIGYGAFAACRNLTSVNLPDGIVKIDEAAFSDTGLTNVTIPRGLTVIEKNVFNYTKITSINIPDHVTQIGQWAFGACDNLTEVNIGSGVQDIDSDAFGACYALQNINVNPKNTRYKSVDGVLYGGMGIVFGNYPDGQYFPNTLLRCPPGRVGAFVIPDGTEAIGFYAFSGCNDLTDITIPSSVKVIGRNAFNTAFGLRTIVIPEGVTDILPFAFAGVNAVSIVVPNSVTAIGEGKGSFSSSTIYCSSGSKAESYAKANGIAFSTGSPSPVGDFIIENGVLTKYFGASSIVTIPDNVKEIGIGVFGRARRVTSITIPGSVTKIADSAFYDCANLTSITIPASVKEIGGGVFYGCGKLKNINIDPANSHYKAIDGVLYGTTNGALSSLLMYPTYREGAFAIPNGVTTIEAGAFSNSKITGVTIPNSVTEIGPSAFYSCRLRSVVIPDSVTSIGVAAFRFSTELWSVTLSQNLKSIGNYAFDGCRMLNSITVPKSVTEIGEGALMKGIHIHGVAGSYAETYAKNNNSPFYPVKEAPALDSAAEWARAGIQSAYSKGFIPVDLQDNYKNIITRQEFCRMAVKFVEYATGKSIDTILTEKALSRDSNAFADTSDPDILAAFALGITNGTGNGTFTPNGQFSREQAATMIMNTCKVIGMDTASLPASGFADINTASTWAVDGINFVGANGIMNGTGNNAFSPKGTYTRQESIVTFDRIK